MSPPAQTKTSHRLRQTTANSVLPASLAQKAQPQQSHFQHFVVGFVLFFHLPSPAPACLSPTRTHVCLHPRKLNVRVISFSGLDFSLLILGTQALLSFSRSLTLTHSLPLSRSSAKMTKKGKEDNLNCAADELGAQIKFGFLVICDFSFAFFCFQSFFLSLFISLSPPRA